MEALIITLGFVVLLFLVLINSFDGTSPVNARSAIIITAHPDDECMFFGPTIVSLLHSNTKVFLLCLTSGDYYSEGKVRVKEFEDSCRALGLADRHYHILDDARLPDSPTDDWDELYTQSVISKYVTKFDVDAVVTFDEHGVSGHKNHIALHTAVQNLNISVDKYKLVSCNILRKYSSVFDLLFSRFLTECRLISFFSNPLAPYRAMLKHESQLLWFRYLYILFSRYMFFNTLEPIT